MKEKLLFLTLNFLAITMQGQTTFNNFVPDGLLGRSFPIRTIDLNNDGTPDFKLHYSTEGIKTIIFLETLDENQVLVNEFVSNFDHVPYWSVNDSVNK